MFRRDEHTWRSLEPVNNPFKNTDTRTAICSQLDGLCSQDSLFRSDRIIHVCPGEQIKSRSSLKWSSCSDIPFLFFLACYCNRARCCIATYLGQARIRGRLFTTLSKVEISLLHLAGMGGEICVQESDKKDRYRDFDIKKLWKYWRNATLVF